MTIENKQNIENQRWKNIKSETREMLESLARTPSTENSDELIEKIARHIIRNYSPSSKQRSYAEIEFEAAIEAHFGRNKNYFNS